MRVARQRQTPEQKEGERERLLILRQTPEHREREIVRSSNVRALQTPAQREHANARQREVYARKPPNPFLAIDGEGGGTDALGRQNYLLMRASDATGEVQQILTCKGEHLSSKDCLEFLLDLPAKHIIVGYGIGYDVTQIIRGIPGRALQEIMKPRQGKNGPLQTFWGEYAITYQQGQYFRVGKIDRSGEKPKVKKGSTRTVYEVLGFFQSTFVKAITNFNIGNETERAIIKTNKAIRNEFANLTDEIIEYCTLECRYLAALMTEFREVCHAAEIRPSRWSGAGWLAAAMLKKHGALKRPLTFKEQQERAELKTHRPEQRRPERDPKFEIAVNHAYYGGRFEISRIGYIPGPLYEYDIKSAYPSAMSEMPCALHTKWVRGRRSNGMLRLPGNGELYIANVIFNHPEDNLWCGLPFRKKGGLFWPLRGAGWYWAPEIEAAQKHLNTEILAIRDVWIAKRCCDCQSYNWVNEVYEERQRLGGSTKGYPLKIALNSLYGKRAQRSGKGPFHDAVEAGLITAITRARLIEGIGQAPQSVVMAATDAIYSTCPLEMDIGNNLGQWEFKEWPDMFIAQPGVYFSPTKLHNTEAGVELGDNVKSRGVKRSVIGQAAPQFIQSFKEWFELMRDPAARELLLEERKFPSVPVIIRVFYGNRLALARGKPYLAGKWEDVNRQEGFEWVTKRDAMKIILNEEGNITTFPRVGGVREESEGYTPADFDKVITVLSADGQLEEVTDRMLLEGSPDHIEFLPHEE